MGGRSTHGGGFMKKAFLFPGQGAQAPGMGKDLYETFSVARHTFEEADDLLSFPLSKILFSGSESELMQTRYGQLALFVHSTALLRTLREQLPHLVPDVCSGLSLGEYVALHASNRLSFAETLALVRARAELMNQACERTQGTMAAVLGLPFSKVEEIVSQVNPPHKVWIANYNCPQQTVISGSKEGVEAAGLLLKEAGAKRVLPLQVYGAFHSPFMQIAQDSLAPFIAEAPIEKSSILFVMNVVGDFVEEIDAIRDNLTKQVTHSVRWEQGIQAMKSWGVTFYLEIGSGKTLRGMNGKIAPEATTLSLEHVSDLDKLAKQECLCSS